MFDLHVVDLKVKVSNICHDNHVSVHLMGNLIGFVQIVNFVYWWNVASTTK